MYCSKCGKQIEDADVFCKHCGHSATATNSSDAVAPKQVDDKKSAGCLTAILVVFGAVVVVILILLASISSSGSREAAEPRRITYLVNGTTRSAGLTYENESGGTEQRRVGPLPWTLEMSGQRNKFVYVSAQNQEEYGTIHVAIYVSGQLLQEAESTTRFGIASASGRVP